MKANISTITVSGAHSGVGKTAVVEMLLEKLKGWSCLKVTVLHNGLCPTHRNCGACDKMSSGFSIVSNKKVLAQNGKDTQRFKAAGAGKVFWLKAKPQWLKLGLKEAISKFSTRGGSPPVRQAGALGGKGTKGLIIEGTSVLKYLHPDLAIFVKRDNSLLKDSAKAILKKIDLILTL